LVVIGVIALLIAILIPPMHLAHRQAKQTSCAANLYQLGIALQATIDDWNYYPLWDDSGPDVRYTFIDLLRQLNNLGSRKSGYCPEDRRPDPLNMARGAHFGVRYPGTLLPGIDYSYGIGVPLSAGGWSWQQTFSDQSQDVYQRRFEEHESNPAARVLAADAFWSTLYNLSGFALTDETWNRPTQFDNMAAWRHLGPSANMLMQDGHVVRVVYHLGSDRPVDTQRYFVWHADEPINVGPYDRYGHNYYPDRPPVNLLDKSYEGVFPRELIPAWYSDNGTWSDIDNK
jgi:prepilin-type processing-associated H-X9-DG protein